MRFDSVASSIQSIRGEPREVADSVQRVVSTLSPTNQRAVLSIIQRLGRRLREGRNGNVRIDLFIKSGSIAQNISYEESERLVF